MNARTIRTLSALSLLAALAGYGNLVQAEQVQARVISTAPVTESNGSIRYNVTYEYAGRQYQTRVSNPPGASIWIDANAFGITTPVAPQPQLATGPANAQPTYGSQQPDWSNITPEPGVVVSSQGAPAPAYGPNPVYVQPAPVYVQPAPAYYPPPVYYPAPAMSFPPIGISLGLGYSRGWGGRVHGGIHGRWR